MEPTEAEIRLPKVLNVGSLYRRLSSRNDVLPTLLPGEAGGDELGKVRAQEEMIERLLVG